MADPTKRGDQGMPEFSRPESVPFIYFDVAGAHGIMAGAVQVEMFARTLVPVENGGTRVEFVATCHLRCSPAAAENLRDALNSALRMLKEVQEKQADATQAAGSSTLN